MSTEVPPPVQNAQVWDKVLPGPGILLSRALLYVVLLLIASATVWAAVTRLDIVVYAAGG